MIALIYLILCVIAIILLLLEHKKNWYDRSCAIEIISWSIILVQIIAFVIVGGNYLCKDMVKRDYQLTYEVLSNDKDNPYLGVEIATYNKEVLWHQQYQKDFWIGPFIPNIYDDMKLIETNSY